MGVTKSLWVGKLLAFPTTSSTTNIGIMFSNEFNLYRYGAGTYAIDANTLRMGGDTIPKTTASYDLGTSSVKWRQLFVSGIGQIQTGEFNNSFTTNNAFVGNSVYATNGVASFSTTAAVSIASSGWTNTFGVNAQVHMDAAAADLVYSVTNNAGTWVYTSSGATAHGMVILQPGGKVITTGTAVSGKAFPF
jgi:hypothetical protein